MKLWSIVVVKMDKSMARFKPIIRLLILCLLIGGLLYLFRSFMITYIIGPIAMLVWALWRIVASVDQSIYWYLLLFIWAALAIRLIPFRRNTLPNPAYKEATPRDRVEVWLSMLEESVQGAKETALLRDRLLALLAVVLDLRSGSDTPEVDLVGMVESAPLSQAAKRYLLQEEVPGKRSLFAWSSVFLPILPPRFRDKVWVNLQADKQIIGEILEYMEANLQIDLDLPIITRQEQHRGEA